MKRVISLFVIISVLSVSLLSAEAASAELETVRDEVKVNKEVKERINPEYLTKKELMNRDVSLQETSLGIDIPNVDKRYVDQLALSYNLSMIDEDKLNITSNQLEKITKWILPELSQKSHGDISYEELMIQSFEIEAVSKELSSDKVKLLSELDITQEDYYYLLKYYYNIDNIVIESKDELIRLLKNYYYSKLYTLQLIDEKIDDNQENTLLRNTKSPNNSSISGTFNGELYYLCAIPLYGTWWFHEDSGTHLSSNNIRAGNCTQDVYEELYDVTTSYHNNCWQLWGEKYDHDSYGYTAHEGLDLGRGRGTRLNAIIIGSAKVKSVTDNYGEFSYFIDKLGIPDDWTVFYLHTRTYSNQPQIGVTIYDGNKVAEESDKGVPGSVHTHFSVNRSSSTSYGVYKYVGLESDSPYDFIEMHGN